MKIPDKVVSLLKEYRSMRHTNDIAEAEGKRRLPHTPYEFAWRAREIAVTLMSYLPDADMCGSVHKDTVAKIKAAAAKKKKPVLAPTAREIVIQKFLDKITRGSTMELVIVRYGGNLVWARWPGKMEWAGIGSQHYRSTWHYLLDLTKEVEAGRGLINSYALDHHDDGKMPLAKKREWRERIQESVMQSQLRQKGNANEP